MNGKLTASKETDDKAGGAGTVIVSRRIIVGLDTGFMAREALMLAARVAASVDARLSGIFVEDENLLGLSALPFVQEISFSGETRPVDDAEMLRRLRAQARIARHVLESVAKEAHVEFSFNIARGHKLAALAAQTGADDTLIIRAHDLHRHDVGRAVRAATRDARADVLLAGRGVAVSGSFAANPSQDSPHLAVSSRRPMLAIDEGSSRGEACVGFAESLALRIGAPFRRLFARGFASADLAAAARKVHAGLVIVNADALGDDDDAARLSAAAGCPVLLLGSERKPILSRLSDG
tara:strand:+ start:116800 stop:117681 length:882 start_codon:yes stop_codon:yes gene_type:complete